MSGAVTGDDQFPRRAFPCDECPMRADNAGNPRAKFPASRWDALTETVTDGHDGASPPLGATLFGCHKGEPGTNEDLGCAGWLATFGPDHVAVRLATFTGRLPHSALEPGPNWPPLHPTWSAVREHQTWEPGDPDEHLAGLPGIGGQCPI